MSTTQTNKRGGGGTKYRVSNSPHRNGNGDQWASYGNLFIDAHGKGGILIPRVVLRDQPLFKQRLARELASTRGATHEPYPNADRQYPP